MQFLHYICLLCLGIGCCGSEDVNCTLYKLNLASAISEFSMCSIENSRPITLCESCVDSYLSVQESYHNLSTISDSRGLCINDYINLDRLQIVETMYRSSYELWKRAKCYECFEMVNNTLTHNRSEETTNFNKHLNLTLDCIYSSGDESCGLCMDEYLALNSYYISISNINEKIGVCMDIVDLMNLTRSQWSKKCCEYRKNKEYIFLATTGFATFITILFYILAKLCTDIKKPEIIRQSRFAESIQVFDSQ